LLLLSGFGTLRLPFPFTGFSLTTGRHIDATSRTLIVTVHKNHFALQAAKITVRGFHEANMLKLPAP